MPNDTCKCGHARTRHGYRSSLPDPMCLETGCPCTGYEPHHAPDAGKVADIDAATCNLCGFPMPKGEEMFNYHGYSSSCPELKCAECGKAVKFDDVGFQCETFTSCKACTQLVEEGWEEDKKTLKGQGLDPDKCDFIERHLEQERSLGIDAALVEKAQKYWQAADMKPTPILMAGFLAEQAPQIRAGARWEFLEAVNMKFVGGMDEDVHAVMRQVAKEMAGEDDRNDG